MKKSKLTGMGIAILISGGLMIGFTSCEPQPDTSKELAEEQNEVTFDDSDAEDDASYLVNAATMLQKNVRWSELAASKATLKDVKAFGSKMAKDHADALAKLQTLATGKSISLPAAPMDNTMDAYGDLNRAKGTEFEKQYFEKIISSHREGINKMESIKKNAEDAEIRAFAANILPSLRSHLSSAEVLQKIVNDNNSY